MRTIRELRNSRGWSQELLARELNVSHSTVYNWEKGHTTPRSLHLQKMALLFGISMDQIAFGVRGSPSVDMDEDA